jgi:hypothetical protein
MLDAVTLTWRHTQMSHLLPPVQLAYMIVSRSVFATPLHTTCPSRACVVPLCAHFPSAVQQTSKQGLVSLSPRMHMDFDGSKAVLCHMLQVILLLLDRS